MERLEMNDGFEGNEQPHKKPFIVIDYKNENEPEVIFNGEASSVEEAEELVREKGIVIDYKNNPDVSIAFEDGDQELAA